MSRKSFWKKLVPALGWVAAWVWTIVAGGGGLWASVDEGTMAAHEWMVRAGVGDRSLSANGVAQAEMRRR
jgi:hypothetical protein